MEVCLPLRSVPSPLRGPSVWVPVSWGLPSLPAAASLSTRKRSSSFSSVSICKKHFLPPDHCMVKLNLDLFFFNSASNTQNLLYKFQMVWVEHQAFLAGSLSFVGLRKYLTWVWLFLQKQTTVSGSRAEAVTWYILGTFSVSTCRAWSRSGHLCWQTPG